MPIIISCSALKEGPMAKTSLNKELKLQDKAEQFAIDKLGEVFHRLRKL